MLTLTQYALFSYAVTADGVDLFPEGVILVGLFSAVTIKISSIDLNEG